MAYYGKNVPKILVLGPAGAGKTTSLYRLLGTELDGTIPTIGINVELMPLVVFGMRAQLMEACGGDKLRPLYRQYMVSSTLEPMVAGVIFVVDSSTLLLDADDARDFLHSYVILPELRGIPILILANKQDLPGALSVEEVRDVLELGKIKDRPVLIRGTIATTGEGLKDAATEMGVTIRQHVKLPYFGWRDVVGLFLSSIWSGIRLFGECMREVFARLFRAKRKPEPRVIMFGVGDAGKTTCLYQATRNEVVYPVPTNGVNIEMVHAMPDMPLEVWDVGGQVPVSNLWRHYTPDAQGIIYVVDSANRDQFGLAREELERVVERMDLPKGIPVAIWANKQDVPDSCSASDLARELRLCDLLKNHPWFVQGTSGWTGQGLSQGTRRLAAMIRELENKSYKFPHCIQI